MFYLTFSIIFPSSLPLSHTTLTHSSIHLFAYVVFVMLSNNGPTKNNKGEINRYSTVWGTKDTEREGERKRSDEDSQSSSLLTVEAELFSNRFSSTHLLLTAAGSCRRRVQ
jgi:hypothetical protein